MYIYTTYTILHADNLKACALLLSHGADPNAKDSEGLTGIQVFLPATGCIYMMDSPFSSHLSPGLHISAHQGLTENCQFLLEHTSGSHANEQDSQGRTALFHAVESGNIECVEYLLNVGFSPDHLDSENRRWVWPLGINNLTLKCMHCTYIPSLCVRLKLSDKWQELICEDRRSAWAMDINIMLWFTATCIVLFTVPPTSQPL